MVYSGGRESETPLESIRHARPGVLGGPVTIDYAFISGTRDLRSVERDWLVETINEHAQRRRQALLAEGHDLTQQARPPMALAELIRKP